MAKTADDVKREPFPGLELTSVEPLDRSTIWPYREGEPGALYYQRYAHPNGLAAERALAELEGGEALLFPSGAGATTALVLGLLEPEHWGVRFVEFDQSGPPPAEADLLWLEAPSNPFLTMPDFEAAAAHPARVVVDSTAATPVYLRPLERGADFALHSATKFLGGHHDVLLGAVACRSADDAARLREFRGRAGIVAAPDPCWLLSRSLKTLPLRMERHTAGATELAERLRSHPAVQVVRYPGFGGLLSFDVADGEAAHTVEISLERIKNATSLGGVDSVLESRSRWEGDRVPAGLLRLSVGLEDPDELWADLEQALTR